jgi:tubulin polyglutamylase TTLL5
MWENEIKEHGHDVKIVQLKIEDIVIKTLISAEDMIASGYNKLTGVQNAWFELYGFDIMFDSNMKPWLLEINTNPSLSSTSTLDKVLKTKLVWDMLTLVGVKPINFAQLKLDEKRLGKLPLREDEYEGCNTYETRNKRRAQIMNSIDFKNLDQQDIDTILNFEEEFKRMGSFRRIFPNKNNFRDYTKFFYTHRYNNLLLWKYNLKVKLIA